MAGAADGGASWRCRRPPDPDRSRRTPYRTPHRRARSLEHSGSVFDQHVERALVPWRRPAQSSSCWSRSSPCCQANGSRFCSWHSHSEYRLPWRSSGACAHSVEARSSFPSAKARKTLVVALVGAALAIAAYSTFRLGWDPAAAARSRGFLDAAQIAYASPMILGVVAGLSAATLVLASKRTGLPIIGCGGPCQFNGSDHRSTGSKLDTPDVLYAMPRVRRGALVLITALVTAASLGVFGPAGTTRFLPRRSFSSFHCSQRSRWWQSEPMQRARTPSLEADIAAGTSRCSWRSSKITIRLGWRTRRVVDRSIAPCSPTSEVRVRHLIVLGFWPATAALRHVHDPFRQSLRAVRQQHRACQPWSGDAQRDRSERNRS